MNKCIDIMNVNEFPEYDLMYSDPPWGAGMVKLFETMMRKKVGRSPANNIQEMLYKVGLLADRNKPLILEYSVKESSVVEAIMKECGHKHNETVKNLQGGNLRPFHILSFNTDIKIPENLVGFEAINHISKVLKPKVVFDAFAGIGLTAKAFLKNNVNYIGYELNPVRFEKLEKAVKRYENLFR